GIAELIAWLRPRTPALIVLEATGRIADPWSPGCCRGAVPHGRDQSSLGARFRQGARPSGQDRCFGCRGADAFVLNIQPVPRPWKDDETQALAALLQRRRQVVTLLTAEKNRLAGAHRQVQTDSHPHRVSGTTAQGPR
ncbi:MAG: hypothetical protein IPL99_07165, partial [Candidatus Competibacteraceae bacterium]|nr:hypothetical protein [Candidatus Competibacteraceae bacterium]